MHRRAFTLIELLVVVAIIALLISILLPALNDAKRQARDVICKSNMGQVARGMLLYAQDWQDCLPGSTGDYYGSGAGRVYLDWLGLGLTGDLRRAPTQGTIFRYLNDERVYTCPSHRLVSESNDPSTWQYEHNTSYTGPVVLTGAPITMLKRMRYTLTPGGKSYIPTLDQAVENMMPLILAEEDANWYLTKSKDSAWCNWDQVTDRHKKAGGVAFIDGHAELRKFASFPIPTNAWHMLYEMNDGRFISPWHYGGTIKFGWIRTAKTDR